MGTTRQLLATRCATGPAWSGGPGEHMPRVAVIGCGDVSVVHFEAIAAIPGAELVAVCDTDPGHPDAAPPSDTASRASPITGRCSRRSARTSCTSARRMISTSTVAVDCLAAGVAVLHGEAGRPHRGRGRDRIVRRPSEPGGKIGICFQNRYNATAQAIRTLLDSGRARRGAGRVGDRALAPARPPTTRPGRGAGGWQTSGGGVMINQAIHTLDLLQWLLGDVDPRSSGRVGRHAAGRRRSTSRTPPIWCSTTPRARAASCSPPSANVVDSPVTMEIVTERATLVRPRRPDRQLRRRAGRDGRRAGRRRRRAGVLGGLAPAADRRLLPTGWTIPNRSGSARARRPRSLARDRAALRRPSGIENT